ncbi:sugar kinase [Anoxynatronum sibiricum]|uniref:Sugar kinase n=1 Tax=Anoxynatronum sibiricum TaxID=210623 RepID=A0ABU9VV72_9CLOT
MRFDDTLQLQKTEYDVVAMGELLIDMISTDYVASLKEAVHFQKSFGGSPGNLAVNLAGMSHAAALIASVGDDDFGRYLTGFLQEQRVALQGVHVSSWPTSMVFVTKSRENPAFMPMRRADLDVILKPKHELMVDQCRIFHFTAWALSHQEIRETTMTLIKRAKSQHKLITFDPNYRPVLWEPGHDGVEFINRQILPLVDVIKPSESDAEYLWGTGNWQDVQRRLRQYPDLFVIMTLGARGLAAFNSDEVLQLPAYAREVVDTTGAGDAFWSGFMSGLLRGLTVKDALYQGSYCAAWKLGSIGAICQMPDPESLEKWATDTGKENLHAHRLFQPTGKL